MARVLPAGWVPRYEELQEYHGTVARQFVGAPIMLRTPHLGIMFDVQPLLKVTILECVLQFVAGCPKLLDALQPVGNQPFRVVVQFFTDGFRCPRTFDGGLVGNYFGVFLLSPFGGNRLIAVFNGDQKQARLMNPAGKMEYMVTPLLFTGGEALPNLETLR